MKTLLIASMILSSAVAILCLINHNYSGSGGFACAAIASWMHYVDKYEIENSTNENSKELL